MRLFKIVAGSLLITTGVFCFANPGATFISIAFLLGCAMPLSGASALLAYIKISDKKPMSGLLLTEGILTVILGSLVVSNQLDSDVMIPVFFGMWVMISGILRVTAALTIGKSDKVIYKWLFIQGVVSILTGIYAFYNSTLADLFIVVLVGILFIIQGINVLSTGVIMPAFIKSKRQRNE